MKRLKDVLLLLSGCLAGLVLAALDHVLPAHNFTQGPLRTLVIAVDWLAPPLAGLLTSAAVLYALRHRRLLASERAASQVLAERLQGTERRQAIWVVAAAIAHDLKNPLHNLQLLLEEAESDPQLLNDLLPRMRANAERASERLSELARAGHGREDDAEPLELGRVLDQLHDRMKPTAMAQGTTLSIECPRGLSVRADPLALRSAVENVAANALEALGKKGGGGHLELRAAQSPGHIELTVEDDGPGIDEPMRERLFTPFATGGNGTGLGLAIARALARASGGDLTCQSTLPGSTKFRFTFPNEAVS
ncbi:MAG: HAMP domain-containing histidine kinase [Deltaproteobacteria bacterium]|nr:HAMP domain-containing histidine kinase [Deltaproteobacteria bacterium]